MSAVFFGLYHAVYSVMLSEKCSVSFIHILLVYAYTKIIFITGKLHLTIKQLQM